MNTTNPADGIIAVEAIARHVGRNERLMGLDLGTKTIGLAISDVELRLATPYETIRRKKFSEDAAALIAAAEKMSVRGLVIGLPLNMDGSEGPRVQATHAFVTNLRRLTAMPVAFWDERLSTAAVTRELIANNVSRARRAVVVDRMAAAYVLQGALDRIARARLSDTYQP